MRHNWEYKRLGDVCVVKSGYTPSSDKLHMSGEYPYFKVAEMNLPGNEKYLRNSSAFLKEDAKTFPANSIVFPKNGAAVATNKKRILFQDSVVDLNTAVMVVDISMNVSFVFNFIQNIDFAKLVKRGTIPTLNLKSLNDTIIPVPPMSVQEQIVAELDKINELIEQNRELLQYLDLLAQSLYIHMFGNWSVFEQLSYYVTQLIGGKSLASQETCANKVLKSGAVTYDYFDGSSTKFLPQNYIPIESHKVKVGDVIISRMNTAELVGACAYVFNVEENIFLPDRLWRLEYKSNANPIFLWKSLISETSKRQIRSKASGTSGSMKNISKPLLLSVRIPKVPLGLQEQFAAQVEAIEEQKVTIEKSIAELQTLLDSRMDYWFN